MCLVKMSPEAQIDKLMSGLYQRLFLPRLFFHDHLSKPFPVVQPNLEKDIAQDMDQFLALGNHGLAP
jgi:hypothetical protein